MTCSHHEWNIRPLIEFRQCRVCGVSATMDALDLIEAAKAVIATCPCDPDITPQWNAAWDALKAAVAEAETQ